MNEKVYPIYDRTIINDLVQILDIEYSERHYAEITMLILETGLSLTDVSKLKAHNYSNGYLKYLSHYSQESIKLSDSLSERLNSILLSRNDEDYMFPSERKYNKPFYTRNYQEALTKCSPPNYPISSMMLRKTYIFNLVMAGMYDEAIKKTGQRNLPNLMIYIGLPGYHSGDDIDSFLKNYKIQKIADENQYCNRIVHLLDTQKDMILKQYNNSLTKTDDFCYRLADCLSDLEKLFAEYDFYDCHYIELNGDLVHIRIQADSEHEFEYSIFFERGLDPEKNEHTEDTIICYAVLNAENRKVKIYGQISKETIDQISSVIDIFFDEWCEKGHQLWIKGMELEKSHS